jgi:hypothetical protein
MADDFLKAIIPEWDTLSDQEKCRYRGQLNDMLDGPLNPVKRASDPTPASRDADST